jgi:hypothetical protein
MSDAGEAKRWADFLYNKYGYQPDRPTEEDREEYLQDYIKRCEHCLIEERKLNNELREQLKGTEFYKRADELSEALQEAVKTIRLRSAHTADAFEEKYKELLGDKGE